MNAFLCIALAICAIGIYGTYQLQEKEKLITQALAEACTNEGGLITRLKDSHNFICVIRVKYEVVK